MRQVLGLTGAQVAAAPEADSWCLLARAALQPEPGQRQEVLEVLLEAGAQLRVHDLQLCILVADAPALRRLLRIGTPQVGWLWLAVCGGRGGAGGEAGATPTPCG